MAESTSSGESKFKLHDLVWAKMKGFPFWPARVINNESTKRTKNQQCVLFYGTNDIGYVHEDQIKPYEEHKEQFSKIKKMTQGFKKALSAIEEEIAKDKGVTSVPSVSSTTPDMNKLDLFKNKKTTLSSPAPLTRDYSRTPFKREKRNFDTSNDAPAEEKAPTVPAISNKIPDEKKKIKLAPTSAPKYTSAPAVVKPEIAKEDAAADKMSEMKMMNKSNKSKPSSLKFGFIGLGKLGQQIVKLLLSSGHEITIWNRTPSKCKDFEKLGANIVKTPGDVVRECDITFSCLSNGTASQSIFFGNCGVASEINAAKGYVELTSLDHSTSMQIEAAVKSKRGRYLEAPLLLCSLKKQVEDGKLVALVSGNRSLFDDCGSCFEAICSHVYYLSENAGIAAKMNVIVSTYYGNLLGSLMECITLVERFGLIQKDFVEIITHSPMNSSSVESMAPYLIDQTLIRKIPIDHISRDLGYCLSSANENGLNTMITASVNEVFKQKKHHYF
ncbi:Putative oxidoreductase GLYR1 -like protein [Sarcoptes scabiei]|uniref:Cytokine-like nuclear factor N-PAC n=1 Tax=Sarcoptes scabiei TaxID=52283 RepID=A0A132A6E2_SARSC|nr:Putative oxidoreductase GLYR1 -like protein [Sarcoptes scabiei]KPM06543.1 oxidoreductase GLYR1-like protein [Sarcoptes scabiei]UXI16510.1 Placenta growth factor [Sarcoptes scabiei]